MARLLSYSPLLLRDSLGSHSQRHRNAHVNFRLCTQYTQVVIHVEAAPIQRNDRVANVRTCCREGRESDAIIDYRNPAISVTHLSLSGRRRSPADSR